LPEEFDWIQRTVAINRALGCSYKVEEIMAMPSDLFTLIDLWLEVV